eukprot:7302888-Prymnesium_polylepis.1
MNTVRVHFAPPKNGIVRPSPWTGIEKMRNGCETDPARFISKQRIPGPVSGTNYGRDPYARRSAGCHSSACARYGTALAG